MTVSGLLRPTAFIPHIEDISVPELVADGVRGIMVDLDNTLVGFRATTPTDAVVAWLASARTAGIATCVVTNNGTAWAREVARTLNVPIVANARKPLGRGFRRGLAFLNLDRSAVVVIGDQLFTDVLGAKLFGLRVVLVDPLVRRDPLNTLPLRLLERWLLRDLPRTNDDLADRNLES